MAFKRILVPTDLSPNSLGALRYAEVLADNSGAQLMLVHCRPNGQGRREAAQHLRDILAGCKPTMRGEAIVESGDPLAHILDVAEARDVDLIVMGTEGRSGLRRALMGSVAEAVVRHASCSVMTLRYPDAEQPPQAAGTSTPAPARPASLDVSRRLLPVGLSLARILVPIDFSPRSLEALPVAAGLVSETGGAIIELLHVIDDAGYLHGPFMAPVDISQVARAELQMLHEKLIELGDRALPGRTFEARIGYGEAAPTILEAARQHGSDIIVMTTHGRGGLARLIMGSNAERVVRRATCPVLTVRGVKGLPLDAAEPLGAAAVLSRRAR